MRTLIANLSLIFILTITSFTVKSQQKSFEGILKIKVDLKSKSPDMGDLAMKTVFGIGEGIVVYSKDGNQKYSSSAGDTYYIAADKKVYFKFKKMDTLYVMDYSKDSPKPVSAVKTSEKKKIAGYDCEVFMMKGEDASRKYYYAPQLFQNPDYFKDLTIGNYHIYSQATSSVWLASEEETALYVMKQEAMSVELQPLNDEVFKLPSLPQKQFEIEKLLFTPEYERNGGWDSYLRKNLDADLAAKYVRIQRGETSGVQSVLVKFLVTENGNVENARVVNSKDVHPKLAQEALRVVNESGKWKPAHIYGQKIPFTMQQPVTFIATK